MFEALFMHTMCKNQGKNSKSTIDETQHQIVKILLRNTN